MAIENLKPVPRKLANEHRGVRAGGAVENEVWSRVFVVEADGMVVERARRLRRGRNCFITQHSGDFGCAHRANGHSGRCGRFAPCDGGADFPPSPEIREAYQVRPARSNERSEVVWL